MNRGEELRRNWPVVLAGFCGVMTGVLSLPIMILGPLIHPLHVDMQWSENAIAGVLTSLGVGLVVGTPLSGWLVDRIDPRTLGLCSLALLSALMAGASQVGPNIMLLYAVFFTMGLLCGGTGFTTYARAIGHHFQTARGLALGLAFSGTGIAAIIAPNFVAVIEQHHGWRAAYIAIAGVMIAVMPVIAWGLGRATGDTSMPSPGPAPVRQARPSRFWWKMATDPRFILLILILAPLGLVISGTVLRFVPMLLDQGFSATRAAATASLLGVSMLVGRIGMGWLADRFPASLLMASCCGGAAAGSLAFVLGGADFAVLAILLIGLLWGGLHNLVAFTVMRFFGLENYGMIFSALYGIYVTVGLLSPNVMGLVRDLGGYSLLYLLDTAMFLCAAMAALFAAWIARDIRAAPVPADQT